MGTRTLLLLVLFASSCILAQEDGTESQNPSCPKDAIKFRHLRKYTYSYEASTTSGVTGTADSQSGSKFSCKVELEVPQPCNFILRIKQCTLREVYGVSSEGKALYKKAKNSEDFSNAMSKYEVNFSVQFGKRVILYPKEEEPVNILNIKRGIITALLVPDDTQQTSDMDTVYGKCRSEISAGKKGSSEVTVTTNLKTCDQFTPIRDHVSPLAFFKGLNIPLSTLISSSQSCQYSLEAKRRHLTGAKCVETHLFLPFSHKNQYGMKAEVTQELKLEDSSKTNSREFADSPLAKGLALEAAESPSTSEDAVLDNLMELQKVSTSDINQQRANTFHKLVTALRSLNNDTLGPLVPRLMELSSPIALQALTQCGTPECFGAILQVLRTSDVSPVLRDPIIYAIGLFPKPCTKRIREILNMAQYTQSRASFYALGHAVNNFYELENTITPELRDVADYMSSLIDNDCTGDQDKTFLTLKTIGIMGRVLEEVNPQIKSSVLRCARSQEPSSDVQKAAIQALRKMSISDDVRSTLVQVFQDGNSPVQKRLAAYLVLMKNPSQSDLRKIVRTLNKDDNEQVKNFAASHIVNIQKSQAPEMQELKGKVEETLKANGVPTIVNDFTKLSKNYQFSKNVEVPGLGDNVGAKVEGNIIFDYTGYMPREAMLETTLNVFGESVDLFEVGVEGKGFEPTLNALFGKDGFFPDCATKALYWADGKVPEKVTDLLYKWFGVSRQDKQTQDLKKAVLYNVDKLIKEVRASGAPEAKAYLEILGKELGYFKLSDFQAMENLMFRTFQSVHNLPSKLAQIFSRGTDSDLFVHYIFMDNQFSLPTGSGLQLQVSLSGIIAPGTRAGMTFESRSARAGFALKPAVSVEFVTHLGIQIPEFSKHAVQMNTNMYHESGGELSFTMKKGQVKFAIPAPTTPINLFSINNKVNLVFASKTEVMPSIIENREERTTCWPLITGMNYCINIGYSNASTIDSAPYFPLTGEARYEVKIHPTGEVQEYSLTAAYEKNREGTDQMDSVRISVQAGENKASEARLTVTYNSDKVILTSNLEIPCANIDIGSSIRAYTEYDDSRGSTRTLIAELKSQQVSEVTFTGRLSSDFDNGNGVLSAELSIPSLHMEAKADATLKKILSDFSLQLKSSATICALSGSQNLLFTYDNEKVELDWSTTSNSNVKKIISKLPDISISDIASYPESLKTYANTILDHKVAQTDMTIRHIASQSIVATNNWLQAASRGSPYAQTLGNKLHALRDLNLQELGIPSLPDNLFLNSDGKIIYKFNKESVIINIPLPYAGKTSHQLVAKTLRSPRLELQSVGLVVPEKEYRVPAFTIPEYYQLRVPLIGVLDLSSNLNSNFYNWSASFTGGNTTTDILSFGLRYQVKADSIVDILSYNIHGSAQESYDPRGIYTISNEASLRHTLLEADIRLSEIFNSMSDQLFKGSYSYQARSVLGLEASLVSSVRTTVNNKIALTESDAKSRLNVASLFANNDIILTFTVNTETLQTKIESNYKFDSSYLKATNKLSGMFLKEAVTLKSTTDFQDGALVNTMAADYRDRQLTLKSDTNGNYYNLVGLNRFELTVSKQMAAIRSEYQADYKRHRFYTLLSGSLNSLGLELNADVTLNNQASRGAHKATLKLNQDGLSTSATTSVNFSPLLLESELNADVGSAGAGMKMSASGRYREHSAKISVDGKGSLSELALGSVYQATLLGMDSKHLLNFRVSKEGLRFSNNILGSYDQIKLESSNDLSIAGYVLQFTSKFENSLSSDRFQKHKFDFQMKPYTMTTLLNNELKYGALEFTNNGEVQLEAFKMNINGNIRGAFNKDEIKHSYGFSAGNMVANINTDTVANILGTSHSHRLTLEVAGLSVSFSSNSNCESKDIRFTNRIRSLVQPFTITVDSQTNGDGRLMIFGEQAGQLYSKFILKAEPLSFNLVHDYRGSTKHSFGRGNTHETLLDYNINLLFTPSEQLSSWKLKSRLNQNTYNQEISAFNNADSIGVQLSGQTLADISILDRQVNLPFVEFNPIDSLNLRDNVNTPQEFSISGHIKYDKNKDMHIINLPFIENMSLYFEKVRSALLTALQALQNSLKDVDIDQYVQRYRRALDTASQRMNDYVNSLDLENKARLVKEKMISLAKEYKITAEELQSAVEDYFRRVQIRLQKSWIEMDRYINENFDELKKSIEVLIQRCVEQLKAFDNEYKVREKIIEIIQNIRVSIENMNVNDVGQSLAAWIQNVDEQYHIKANIQRLLHQIQVYIQRFNIDQMAQNVKEFLQSEKVTRFVQQIKDSVPFEKVRFWIEQIKNLVVTQLEEFQVSQKFNAVVDKFQDFMAYYEIDKKLEVLIEKFIEFLNQQKVKETIQMATDMLNNIDLRLHCKRVLTFVNAAVKQIRDYDFKKLIDDINYYLDILVQKMRSFNYDNFVEEFNNKVKELTETVNQKLKALELPQKAEALRQYLNDVRVVVIEYLQQVRETRLAAIAQWYEDIMTSTVLIEWKTRVIEFLEDTRDSIYAMNIKEECQRYLQQVSLAYRRLVILVTEKWNTMAAKISDFAKENNIQDWADRVKVLVEEGIVVPEINLKFIMFPAFEVSLRALREATFRTPYFIVPFTDLEIQSMVINFRNLRSIEIPTRFVTPEFTILKTYRVPSYVIDLNEIKLKLVRIIDQIISSDYTLPSPNILLRDITMSDMGIPEFSIPEMYIPNMQLPEYKIPKLNLENFQFPDIKIPEFQLPKIPHSVSIPTFGKLSGSFKVASPVFTISSLAEVKNATVTEKSPEMIASLTTEATSVIEALAFTFGADARISAPLMEQLVLKETVSLSNRHLKVDHFSQVTFLSSEIRAQIQTKANLMTEKNTAELQNSVIVTLQKRITADVSTKYSHRLNIPQFDISSQLELQHSLDTTVDIGRITLISNGKGNWRWACPLFTDEGTHQADVKFSIKGGSIELSGTNKINDKYLKLDQSLTYNSMFLNFVSIDVMSKADAPNVGNSIATLKGKASVGEMKVELEAAHNAELSGRSTGTINNKFSFLTRAFEIKLSTANNGNLKVSFPLKLTGRIEFLNNYDFTLSPTVQQVSWQANGRFNQYKVAHSILLSNNEENIEAALATNGEANLDFLSLPFSIPEIQVPYTSVKTPAVHQFSLWEKTGLKNLLITTRQNFDLNIKLQYQKNKDVHVIPLPLDAVFDTINTNMKTLNKKFENGRDKALNILVDSYNQAKVKFDKYKVDNQVSKVPRTFRIPGYTIPLVNIEVSSFSADLPAFGYVIPKEISTPSFVVPMIGFSIPTYKLVLPSLEMPVLHVPNSLRRLSLPKFKLPSGQNGIIIPALGNLTYDFFFKSNVISLTTSAGIYNQSDVSARVSVASTSVIDALQFNVDATTGLTRKRGLKLATALALKSVFAEGKHESSISFGKRNVEASVITNAKLDTPLFKSTLKQELTGNTKTKSTVSSVISLTYDYNDALFGNTAKGKLDHTLSLEGLTSYFSVVSRITGDITGSLLKQQAFYGTLTNDANTYINSNSLRSTMRLAANSRVDSLGNLDLTESLAVEASTSRIYAVWEHKGENYIGITPLFRSSGQQSGKATFELALWSLLADLQMKISQPNVIIEELNQGITLNVNTDKQEFSMNGHSIVETLILAHNLKLSNDQTEARLEAGGSLQGHVAFLKSVILPVYDRSLWDVLKLDVTTAVDRIQYLNASTSLIYTKSNDGFFYPIPSERIGDGSTISFPGLTLTKLSLPEIQFPAADIKLLYTSAAGSKIPLVELSAPQYQVTLSKYTLPKKIYDLDFNSLFNTIADIDLPTIEIPEQKIVIPPIKLTMPAGIYIPAFGSISGSVQFASPVYNITWTNKLENKPDSLVGSIDATSSSTLQFLEFDLDASLAGSLNGRNLNLIGQGSLAHVDLSTLWKEEISFNGLRLPQHNFQVDISSPTFTNIQIRCQHNENGLSSSVSSPSMGTLGLLLEKDSKTIRLKVSSRSEASPDKEVLILKNELSLKNPDKIQNKFNWREDAAQDVLNGLKERLPKMSDAVYNCVNKYHKEHLGMDIKEAGQQMKERLQTKVSSAYNSASNHIDNLEYHFRSAARGASGKYGDVVSKSLQWYQDSGDMSFLLNDGAIDPKLYAESMVAIRRYQSSVKEVIDAVITFLKSTRFQLPGQQQKYTGEEQFTMGMKWAVNTMEQFIQKIQSLLETFIQSISDVSFTIPGTNLKFESKQVILAVKDFLKEVQQISKKILNDLQYVSLERNLQQLKGFVQEVSQKSEKIIEALKSRNYQYLQVQTQQMYNDAMNSQYMQYLSKLASEIKKSTSQLLKVYQNIYEELLEKLKQLLVYAKALREEYLDPNIVGWSVKYYEIEDKVLQLFKLIIDSLKDLPSKYGINVSEINDQMKALLNEHYEQSKILLTNAEDKGRKQVRELSIKLEQKVSDWSKNAKYASAEYSQILNANLQQAYDKLLRSYEDFLVEANRLIDLVIQKYNAFIEVLSQMLEKFHNTASEEVKTYVSTRKGEVKVEIPHPFDWKSFDEIPQVKKDIIAKRMEIARAMVHEGIEKGSKQWEELQQLIEKHVDDGKLTAQQIIENIKNWRNKN